MINKNEQNHHVSEIIYKLPKEMQDALPAKHGVIIFAAYGCVLTERQTPSGMYVYTAVSMQII